MNEAIFYQETKQLFNHINNVLEEADEKGLLEAECDDQSLSITFPSGKQLLLSRHAPTRQVWLSSPLIGGLHFSWKNEKWLLADGRSLTNVLSQEIASLSSLSIVF